MNHKALLPSTLAAVALATLVGAGSANAQTYAESGDAGQTLSTAASTAAFGSPSFGQPLTSVTGTIGFSTAGGASDADLYRIFITNPSTFSASTVGNSTLDTSLFLFDLNGRAIIANNDANGTTLQSTLAAGNATLSALPAGLYYLGIALSGADAINSASQLLFNQGLSTDTRTAASGVNPVTLSTFTNNVDFNETGAYGITLTSATAVPEPSTWALSGIGALALGVTLVRRNRQGGAATSL